MSLKVAHTQLGGSGLNPPDNMDVHIPLFEGGVSGYGRSSWTMTKMTATRNNRSHDA